MQPEPSTTPSPPPCRQAPLPLSSCAKHQGKESTSESPLQSPVGPCGAVLYLPQSSQARFNLSAPRWNTHSRPLCAPTNLSWGLPSCSSSQSHGSATGRGCWSTSASPPCRRRSVTLRRRASPPLRQPSGFLRAPAPSGVPSVSWSPISSGVESSQRRSHSMRRRRSTSATRGGHDWPSLTVARSQSQWRERWASSLHTSLSVRRCACLRRSYQGARAQQSSCRSLHLL